MAVPTLRFYNLSSGGDDNLARLLLSGGPTGTEVGTSVGVDDWSFGDVQAGAFGPPKVLALRMDAETAKNFAMRLYDYTSVVGALSEAFYGTDSTGAPSAGDWDFRIKIYKNYVSPASIDSAAMATWDYLPRGVTVAGYAMETNLANPGNRPNVETVGSLGKIVAHSTLASTWVFNGYIYIASKPDVDAIGGLHTNWGYRLNYTYPAI